MGETKTVVAELLRKVGGPGCTPMKIARAARLGEPDCDELGCDSCLGRTLSVLADAIDAEVAVARDASARDGMAIIAEAEGWPALRDGESVVEWMGRCWLPRPRYEDGSLVETDGYADGLGSKIESIDVTVGRSGEPWYTIFDETDQIEGLGPFKRRVMPLGADGVPIEVGEMVWSTVSGRSGIVLGLSTNGGSTAYVEWEDRRWSPGVLCDTLAHTPPDTQEVIDAEATMPPTAYCAQRGIDLGDDPDRESATAAMIADLLRRQRELDKRTGGE